MPEAAPLTIATFPSRRMFVPPEPQIADQAATSRPAWLPPPDVARYKAARRGEQVNGPSRHEVRHLSGTVPSCGGKPDAGDQSRCRIARVAGLAWLRRSLDRRTSFRRLGTDRVAGADHRRRRGAHQAHQARHRRDQSAVPSSVHGGAALRAARSHDAWPRDDGLWSRRADVRCLHARHRAQYPAPAHAGGDGRDHAAAEVRRACHHEDRLVRDARLRGCISRRTPIHTSRSRWPAQSRRSA